MTRLKTKTENGAMTAGLAERASVEITRGGPREILRFARDDE